MVIFDLEPLVVAPEADAESRRMFVSRLENLRDHGGNPPLSIQDVLALLSDCDMLTQRSYSGGGE